MEDGDFLGFVGLIRFDWDAQESEIGYVIAPAARGRGIAGRAIELTSRWGFDDLGLERIEAWIDVENEASQRVAERAGYRREGVRRWSAFKEGKRVDMAIYSAAARRVTVVRWQSREQARLLELRRGAARSSPGGLRDVHIRFEG